MEYNASQGSDSARFDVLNLEYEYWNHDPRDFSNYITLLQGMNNLAEENGLLSEAYLGYPCPGATPSEAIQIAAALDRLLIHYYVTDPKDAYYYCYDQICGGTYCLNNRLSWFSDRTNPLDVWPIFSGERKFMGPWLRKHSMNDAEDIFVTDYLLDNLGDTSWKAGINLSGFQYYSYKHLTATPVTPVISTLLLNQGSVPQDGLIAYYPLNGNALDESGNEHNGTAHGSVQYVAGKIGQCASLDGTDAYINVPDSDQLDVSTFTISLWMKPASLPSINMYMVSKTSTGQDDGVCLFLQNDGKLVLHWEVSNTDYNLTSNEAVEAGKWTHVVATYDGSVDRIYINGSQDNIKNINKSPPKTDYPFQIGVAASQYRFFEGLIDEVRLYDYSLSNSEVHQLYNSN